MKWIWKRTKFFSQIVYHLFKLPAAVIVANLGALTWDQATLIPTSLRNSATEFHNKSLATTCDSLETLPEKRKVSRSPSTTAISPNSKSKNKMKTRGSLEVHMICWRNKKAMKTKLSTMEFKNWKRLTMLIKLTKQPLRVILHISSENTRRRKNKIRYWCISRLSLKTRRSSNRFNKKK